MEKDSIIVRQQYVDAVLQRIDMGQIIVLTGQRRVGKSCVMRMVRDAVLKKNSKATIIFIDKEYTEFRSIKKDEDLENYVYPLLGDADDTYLFIDEVQDIQGFENTLRSMQAKQQCHIIVTGSNAKMLSSELSTYLSGRYTEVHIQSLSYVEFIKFHNLDDSDASLLKYLTY
jgi:predicted AAA+ superfamily ATPase